MFQSATSTQTGQIAAFESFLGQCDQFLDTKDSAKLSTLEKKLIGKVYANVVKFINDHSLSSDGNQLSSRLNPDMDFAKDVGCESFRTEETPGAIFQRFSPSDLETLCLDCRIDKSLLRPAMENLAKMILNMSAGKDLFYNNHFAPVDTSKMQLSDLTQIIPQTLHAEVFAGPGLEAFGIDTDKVVPDIRVALTITILKFHKGLLNRVMHRRTTAMPVVTYVIPWGEAYDLQKSADPKGSERESQNYRKPMIQLYADPTMVSNTLRRIELKKDNDVDDGLYADDLIRFGSKINLMDLSRIPTQLGFQMTDYSDLIADGVILEKVLVRATREGVTEDFEIVTRGYGSARLLRQNNTRDSGDRSTIFNQTFQLNKNLIPIGGTTPSAIFAALTPTSCLNLDLTVAVQMSVKWANCQATGAANVTKYHPDSVAVPAEITAALTGLTVTPLAYAIDSKFSEENLRKTNIALRSHVYTKQWEIPVGRNYVVDYALQQSVPEFTMGMMTEAISLGQDDRALKIISTTLRDVYDRMKLESADPRFRNQLDKIGYEYIASQHVNPYVILMNLDMADVDSIRSSDILGDMRQYVELNLLNVFSLLHQNSFYKQQLNAGEKPCYKVITSNIILENLFSIPHIHNHIQAAGDQASDGDTVEYTRVLPNGTVLECVSTTYNTMRDKILIFPYRSQDPESFLNAGHNWDFGTYMAHYNPQVSGGIYKRVFANARELPLMTNPMGVVITVENISKVIDVYEKLNNLVGNTEPLPLPSNG